MPALAGSDALTTGLLQQPSRHLACIFLDRAPGPCDWRPRVRYRPSRGEKLVQPAQRHAAVVDHRDWTASLPSHSTSTVHHESASSCRQRACPPYRRRCCHSPHASAAPPHRSVRPGGPSPPSYFSQLLLPCLTCSLTFDPFRVVLASDPTLATPLAAGSDLARPSPQKGTTSRESFLPRLRTTLHGAAGRGTIRTLSSGSGSSPRAPTALPSSVS